MRNQRQNAANVRGTAGIAAKTVQRIKRPFDAVAA